MKQDEQIKRNDPKQPAKKSSAVNPRREGAVSSIALAGVMSAVCCILGPLVIPVPGSPVPISLMHLAIFLSLYALGMKLGTLSVLIYLLIGTAGLPVFSGYQGGPSKLLGPTGGYLIGYLFMAAAAGFVIDRTKKRYLHFLGMALGCALCYLFGTAWIMYQLHMKIQAALAACIIPYLPGDLLKIIFCLITGPVLRSRLISAGLFPYQKVRSLK